MASETPEDDANPAVNTSTDVASDEPPTDASTVSYEEISFKDQAGFKPMIGVFALVLITFVFLIGLPMYSEPGDGSLTLFSYTAPIWGAVIIAGGFIYEFWLMKVEGGGW